MLLKIIRAGLSALLFLFALMILGAMLGSWTALGRLTFGWLNFLQRTLPDVTVNWSGIGMVALCSAVMVAGIHWLCSSLRRAATPEALGPWRWRWTFALFASLWVTFGIVIGASGA